MVTQRDSFSVAKLQGMPNENRIKLADLVRQNRHELLKVWRNKVQQVPSTRNLDTPAAGSHIARLLDDLAAALMEGKKKPLITLPVGESTEVHGVQRFQEGFDLIEIVADYNALREAIQEFAEANRLMITGRVRAIMDRVLDKAIGVAVQTYSEQKAIEIERQREEHLSFIIHDLKTPLSADWKRDKALACKLRLSGTEEPSRVCQLGKLAFN